MATAFASALFRRSHRIAPNSRASRFASLQLLHDSAEDMPPSGILEERNQPQTVRAGPGGNVENNSLEETPRKSIVPASLRTRTTETCDSERPAFSPRATWDSTRLSAIAGYSTADLL